MATYLHRIQVFDTNGTYLSQFGSYGTGDGQFNEPWRMASDADGNIYVYDTQNARIVKFDGDGQFVWNTAVPLPPSDMGLTVAGGKLFTWRGTSEGSGGWRLTSYHLANGAQLSSTFVSPLYTIAPGTWIENTALLLAGSSQYVMLPAYVRKTVVRVTTRTHSLAFFDAATSAYVGKQDMAGAYNGWRNLFASATDLYAELGHWAVYRRYRPVAVGASVQAEWSQSGYGTGIAEGDDHVFVTNQVYGAGYGDARYPVGGEANLADNNPKVYKYTKAGALVTSWGALGAGAGQFGFVTGIACANGKVYVADVNFYPATLATVYDPLFGFEHHATAKYNVLTHWRARPGQPLLSTGPTMGAGLEATLTVEDNGDLGAFVRQADGTRPHRVSRDDGRTWS
ncbi:MAG: 6-bladed beta-propeller [Armatimonadota bacterium]